MKAERSRKTVVMMIVISIMLLPVQFGRVVIAGSAPLSMENAPHSQSEGHCKHMKRMQASAECDHSSSGDTADNSCCDDNCSGAQIFLPATSGFHSVASASYLAAGSQHLPDPITSPQYRPPITSA
ncbi:MAG: hypothetical protein KDI68_01255 [Gammaproteobacteria bacterium]|nr:hypothetical protein [Gammaproteobacteria bacterium]